MRECTSSKQTNQMNGQQRDTCEKHLPKYFFLFIYLCMNGVYNHFIFLIFGTSDAFIGQGFIYSLLSNLSVINPVCLYPLSQQAQSSKVACTDILLQSVPSIHMLKILEKNYTLFAPLPPFKPPYKFNSIWTKEYSVKKTYFHWLANLVGSDGF